MLILYGKKLFRAGRCLWALEELGLPYRLVPTDPTSGGTRTPEFLALNPMAKVPVLVDGDFVLTESVAINVYLASLAATPLWPSDRQIQGRIHQWTSWAITEVEFHFTTMVRELRRSGEPDQARIVECLESVEGTLKVLEAWLSKRDSYVAGPDFTIGDINVAFPIAGIAGRIDMTRFPAVQDWLARCTGRAAWQRVQTIDEAALSPA